MTFEHREPGVFVDRLGYRLIKSGLTWSVAAPNGAELGAHLASLDLANETATLHARRSTRRGGGGRGCRSEKCAARLRAADDAARIARVARAELETVQAQLRRQRALTERQERQLDALGMVWCDGGCEGGLYRFAGERTVTAGLIAELIGNARRALRWYMERAQRGVPVGGKRAAARRALREVFTLLPEPEFGERMLSKQK